MKKLTKIALLFVVALVCLAAATTVNAATCDQLREYITEKFDTNLTVEVDKYLKLHPVTDEVADEIIDNIETILDKVGDEKDLDKLSATVKSEVKALAEKTAEKAGLKLEYANGVATLYSKGENGFEVLGEVEKEALADVTVDDEVKAPAKTEKNDPEEKPADEPKEDPTEDQKTDPAKDAAEDDKKEDKGEAETTGVVYTNIIIALVVVGLAGLGIAYFVKKD